MNDRKKLYGVIRIFCVLAVLFLGVVPSADAQEVDSSSETEYLTGKETDISLDSLSAKTVKAGKSTRISFRLTGAETRKYTVSDITQVWIDRETDDFPLTSAQDAYRILSGNGNSMECNFQVKTKNDLKSGYYKIYFNILYQRKAADGTNMSYAEDYLIRRSVNIYVKNTADSAQKAEVQTDDLSLKMKNMPQGSYGGICQVSFCVESKNYHIKSVVPVMDDNVPFESNSEAYKVIRGNAKKLDCTYSFRVKGDVKTGYDSVKFDIFYEKDGSTVKLTRTVQVYLQGKKQAKKRNGASQNKNTSVPRVVVQERTLSREKIYPGDVFVITMKLQNMSSQTVQNLKYTISSESGEFSTEDGVSSRFISSISPGEEASVSFRLQTSRELTTKTYQICLFAEYEDEKANGYEATDYVAVPVVVHDKLTITNVSVPKGLTVGTEGDVTFSVNNIGENKVRSVSAALTGTDFSAEKISLGKVNAGESGYADIVVMGLKKTGTGGGKNARIQVSYINSSGEKKKLTKKIRLDIGEEVSENLEELAGNSDTNQKSGAPVQIIVLLAAAACVGVGGTWMKLKKRRSK